MFLLHLCFIPSFLSISFRRERTGNKTPNSKAYAVAAAWLFAASLSARTFYFQMDLCEAMYLPCRQRTENKLETKV